MLDPFCAVETFGDAVQLGWACDDYKFLWWEDPYKDGGVSAFSHRKLRQLVRTPLLQTEHVRGLEAHTDFVVAEGTDFVRGDVNYDGGITGVMKICHATEGFGLDCELHGGSPAHQHIMCSVRNMNFLEAGLYHPKVEPARAPIYLNAPNMDKTSVGADGCFDPPGGPGLGLEIDWDYIRKHQTDGVVYE
jgi:L-alanine-DL-glutamate epimerase-like enolase superfamily enzyme